MALGTLLSGTHRYVGGRFLLMPRHRRPAQSGDGSLWPHLPSAWWCLCILSSFIHSILCPFHFLHQCRSGQLSGFHLKTNPFNLMTESFPCCCSLLPPLLPSRVSCDRVSHCECIPPSSCGHSTPEPKATGRALRWALEIQSEGGPRGPFLLSLAGVSLVPGVLSPCTPGFSPSFPTPSSGSQPRPFCDLVTFRSPCEQAGANFSQLPHCGGCYELIHWDARDHLLFFQRYFLT